MTVADSAAPAADRVGWTLTKEVEVQLAFSGMYAGKMLYGKKSLTGEASHIELFDAYGITPRKYEFPDGLDGVATLPFHEVTHDKKKYVFCAAANDTTNGIAVGLLYEIASGALVEKDLTTLTRGGASKDGKHVKAAAASLEVRSWGVCAWFAVRACSRGGGSGGGGGWGASRLLGLDVRLRPSSSEMTRAAPRSHAFACAPPLPNRRSPAPLALLALPHAPALPPARALSLPHALVLALAAALALASAHPRVLALTVRSRRPPTPPARAPSRAAHSRRPFATPLAPAAHAGGWQQTPTTCIRRR